MQAQQSLFQSAFKDPNQRVAHGVKKSIPFLNLWAPSADVQRQQEQKRQFNMASATSFYDFKPLDKKGTAVPLDTYKGKVVLVVNTASKCGFTPQYQGLESLYKKIQASNPDQFVILGFPCNQFGGQEPGTDEEIQSFCQVNYGVSFPIMGKTDVNGDKANPLFEWLKNEQPGLLGMKRVKWNFEKWLVGKDGKVKGRWASTTKPEGLEKEVLAAINEA
ncbi:glutathione peroxidase [Stipitochalara longipes BDJ]|nr:glutathione peroxidase [Stipitochalara longipes BDJ]